jgi:DNA-binding transcriptional MerR regulator
MDLVSMGEFARLSRLSPKALRLYDDLGLLPPARVDPDSGYRWYSPAQLERARLVASLRAIGMPLARIRAVVDLEPAVAARAVAAFSEEVEAEHDARRALARAAVAPFGRKEVRHVRRGSPRDPGPPAALPGAPRGRSPALIALGKTFVQLLRDRPLPSLPGTAGAAFLIYHGEMTEDSDGLVERCKPVPDDQAKTLAGQYPELCLCREAAHEEASVHLGTTELTAAPWEEVSEAPRAWAAEHHRRPSDLGVRVTDLAERPVTAQSRPDCDFAVPFGSYPAG